MAVQDKTRGAIIKILEQAQDDHGFRQASDVLDYFGQHKSDVIAEAEQSVAAADQHRAQRKAAQDARLKAENATHKSAKHGSGQNTEEKG